TFVRLRISNSSLFSGKRNASMWAWRAILQHMGLQQKMTYTQASKKWENLKKRYKELKNPPKGMRVFPESWCHFALMDDAIMGRLEGSAPILKALPSDKDDGDFLPISKPKKKKVSSSTGNVAGESEVILNEEEDGEEETEHEGRQVSDCVMLEGDNKRTVMDRERQVMEKEKLVMESEWKVLQKERAVLDREVAALDRDRASLERERALIEREKALMEKDRYILSRERMALEQEKARLERLNATKDRTEDITEDSSKRNDLDTTDRRERFLYLFEKLVENF
uniref:Si:dkeyp-38g8.5 n=2 Tax=Echeneis naucrates TaxID=173247 RepID=A0A665WGM5_ECHNA